MEELRSYWKKCSNCKKEISFNANYYVCSVSTCTRERTGLHFCSVSCWSAHVPLLRHRDAWAVETKAPLPSELTAAPTFEKIEAKGTAPAFIKVEKKEAGDRLPTPNAKPLPKDVLVVVSKLKSYIDAKAEMNTSADVIDILSDRIRRLCDDAIMKARSDGRKTVMARDF